MPLPAGDPSPYHISLRREERRGDREGERRGRGQSISRRARLSHHIGDGGVALVGYAIVSRRSVTISYRPEERGEEGRQRGGEEGG
jgi:hypothetical protein